MDDQVFADGIGTIAMIGGTVRVDLLTYSPVDLDPSGQPRPVFRQRIIMGVDAFLSAAEKLHEAAQAIAGRSARPELAAASESRATPEKPAAPIKPPFP